MKPSTHPTHVLVVDDNTTIRRSLDALLSAAGFRVALAAGGREAVDMVTTHRYRLILIDCFMPDQNGHETTRLIRAIEQREHRGRTPILGMANNLSPELKRWFLESGMDSIISKLPSKTDLDDLTARWDKPAPGVS